MRGNPVHSFYQISVRQLHGRLALGDRPWLTMPPRAAKFHGLEL